MYANSSAIESVQFTFNVNIDENKNKRKREKLKINSSFYDLGIYNFKTKENGRLSR